MRWTPEESKAGLEAARKARFKDEADVKEAIEWQVAMIKILRERAEKCEERAMKLVRKWGVKPDGQDKFNAFTRIGKLRDRAIKSTKRADKIEGSYLSRLKQKLSVIQTKTLPFMGEDISIPK